MLSAKIAIAGAGSIGCFVGGMLMAGGRTVSFLGRPRVIDEIKSNGLVVSSFEGAERRFVSADVAMSTDATEVFADAAFVLVTVKSNDTAAVADLIATHAPADAVIVSLQNGVGNVPVLRVKLPGRQILAGMVPFNVIALGAGRFHRASSGDVMMERDDADTAAHLSVAGLRINAVSNMPGVQWGKLLINLNNALNALSGLPLRDQLAQRPWRVLFADQIEEALPALRAEGINPISTTPLPASWTPAILKLPDGLFRTIAKPMVKIDPKARSSMWEDLQHRRRTEIDHLQGLIVTMCERHGLSAPLSKRIVGLIRQAEQAGNGSPALTPEQVRASEI